MAAKKLSAKIKNVPLYKTFLVKNNYKLPYPLMNIINGGAHASNNLDIQEFMIVPHGFKKLSEALRAGAEVFAALKKILHEQNQPTTVGDEGGFAPTFDGTEDAIETILKDILNNSYKGLLSSGFLLSIFLICSANTSELLRVKFVKYSKILFSNSS